VGDDAGRSSEPRLLGRETGESVMMFQETAPSDTETTYHLHHDSDEVAYVLAGEITFPGGRSRSAVRAPAPFIPRGLAHALKKSGAKTAPVQFLYTRAAAGGFFEGSQRLQRSYEVVCFRRCQGRVSASLLGDSRAATVLTTGVLLAG